jgi:hypothetical protein
MAFFQDRGTRTTVMLAGGAFMLSFVLLSPNKENVQAPARQQVQQAQAAGPVVHELMKCEDREALENRMGLEMVKRAIPVAEAKLAIGDVPPEIEEKMRDALRKAKASLQEFRNNHPCL